MSIRTKRMAVSERSQSQRLAQEFPWPLPLGGLFSDATRSEINGGMADVLSNWRSDGLALAIRDGYAVTDTTKRFQRIPFEFGANTGYVDIVASQAIFGDLVYGRSFSGSPVMYATISSNVIFTDGEGPILRCDGTQITKSEFTTTTGKNVSEFDGIFSHHDRIYLWDSDELQFYYGDIGAVTGEVTRFPLDRLGNISGTIVAMDSITLNAAHGMNDVLVIFTSKGQIILYEGLDPGDANDWRLLGRLKAAAPISKFATANFGSDLWVVTKRGIMSVRDSLANGLMALSSEISRPIADLIVKDVAAYGSLEGWSMAVRADGSDVLINVPTGSSFKQYSYSVEGKAWNTADYPAKWWHELDGYTEFTDMTGQLCRVQAGGDAGQNITAIWHTSWMRIGRFAEVAYLIPTIIADSELQVTVTVLTDHDQTPSNVVRASQTVTVKPDKPGTGVALNELIAVNAAGRVFQARFEITGQNVSFEKLIAGLV